jgi:hypothetical protein
VEVGDSGTPGGFGERGVEAGQESFDLAQPARSSGPAGAAVGARLQFAHLKVLVEVVPLGIGGFAVLGLGSNRAALIKEGAVPRCMPGSW